MSTKPEVQGNTHPADGPDRNALTRRRVFAGVGTAGALAAVAAVVPLAPRATAAAPAGSKVAAADADGYQVTEHVLRYYQTARV